MKSFVTNWLSGLAMGVLASATIAVQAATDQVIRVGVTSGPHAQIFEQARRVFERDNPGYKVKIIEFNDYIQPNAALDAGELDANSYQHRPFLNAQIKARGYKLYAEARP
jgi:D-methionine transport system substrate-binding protein